MKPEIVSGQVASAHGTITTPTLTASSIIGNSVPTATPEVDEDEYSIKPPTDSWDKTGSPQKSEFVVSCFDLAIHCCRSFAGNFYSSSDSESEEEMERKIRVEIKPLNNGTAPISASVDELRATVENLSLSPIGALSVNAACIILVTLKLFSALSSHENCFILDGDGLHSGRILKVWGIPTGPDSLHVDV